MTSTIKLLVSRKKNKSHWKIPFSNLDQSKFTKTFTLNNGLGVILHRILVIDMVSVYLRVNTGSSYEGKFLGSGISHFLEHCMFLGSKKFPNKDEFSNLIQGYGGVDLNAFTGENTTCYQFSVFSHYLLLALDALHNFIFHPLLRPQDIMEERGTVISEMDIYDDKPFDWFYRLIFSRIFNGKPNELPIIGLRKLFQDITAQDLKEYHRNSYCPENISLCLVGNFDVPKVKQYLDRTFSSPVFTTSPHLITKKFFPGGQKGYWRPTEWIHDTTVPKNKLRVTETSHHRAEFVRAVLCWEGCDFFHSDNYTLDIISHIIASGRGSILHEVLKEKLSWVERISSFSLQTYPHSLGKFFIEFTLPQMRDGKAVMQTTSKVVFKILYIFKEIKKYLTQELLEGSRNTFLKACMEEKEDFIEVATTLSHSLSYFGHLNYEREYFEYINHLTLKDTIAVIEKYLHPQPHLFLLLPENLFDQGEVFAEADRSSSRKLSLFEKSLEKGISNYIWQEVPPVLVKQSFQPQILCSDKLHTTKKEKLSNQVCFLHKKITGLPKACLQLIFHGGSVLESETTYHNGSFNLLSQMFFTSNQVHSKKEIVETMRHHGVIYSSFCGENTFGLGFSFLKGCLPDLLVYLNPILSSHSYKNSDFVKEKKDVIYVLKKAKEDSFREAMRQFKKYFFAESGYGLDPKGKIETIENIKAKEVALLKKHFVIGSNLTAHLCGNFDGNDIGWVRESLEKLNSHKKLLIPVTDKTSNLTQLRYQGVGSLITEYDPGQQSHFIMGYRTPQLGEGNGTLKLVSHYLEGIGGPLFKLRSSNFIKNGKDLGGRCYRLGCFLKTSLHYGMLVFYASFRKEAAGEHFWALESFQKELDLLRNELIEEKEMERAKTCLVAEMKTQSIKYHHLSFNEGLLEAYGKGHDFGEKEVAQLQRLTAHDLREAVNQYLKTDNFLGYLMKPQG